MQNITGYDKQIDKVINDEISSWDKNAIVNSEDQQQSVNFPEEEQKEDLNQQPEDWTRKEPDEKPGDDPGNDTDDSDETKKKLPNG